MTRTTQILIDEEEGWVTVPAYTDEELAERKRRLEEEEAGGRAAARRGSGNGLRGRLLGNRKYPCSLRSDVPTVGSGSGCGRSDGNRSSRPEESGRNAHSAFLARAWGTPGKTAHDGAHNSNFKAFKNRCRKGLDKWLSSVYGGCTTSKEDKQ